MDERKKLTFWAFAAAVLVAVCVPSTILLDALQRYGRFLRGFEPQTLRPSRASFLAHRGDRPGQAAEPRLQFVEFRLRAPRARKVQLAGDFNGWREETLRLLRQGDSDWEVMLPLPRGRHRYLFVVDGRSQTDPKNPQSAVFQGRRVSVKAVP